MGIDDVARPQMKFEVVIVDDETAVSKMMSMTLEKNGFHVKTYTSAYDALQALKIQKPHLLISDIGLVGMNGFELYREAIKIHPDLQIIFSSGNIYELDSKGLTAGMQLTLDNFLQKPMSCQQLVERAEYFCKKSLLTDTHKN